MISNSVTAPTIPPTRPRPTPAEERVPAEQVQGKPPASLDAPGPQPAPENTPRKSGSGAVVFWLVLAALAGTGWYYRAAWWPTVSGYFGAKEAAGKPPARVIPVVTAPVRQQDVRLFLNGLGTVTPLKTVTVRPRVEGEIVNITFTEGQMVKEGDLLAEIDQRPFVLQRDQAAGQLARDEATLASAKYTLDRYEQLLKEKIIPLQQVQEQRALVQQTEGAIKTDRALIENAELQIAYSKITAPVSGRIGLRLVDIGNIVRANDAGGIAVINQIQPIAIVFTISQDEIPRVQDRIRAGKELLVDAYDRSFATKLASGTLLATDNQVDAATGTLRLKAVIEKDADRLFPNQFVNTRLLVEELPGAITVPSVAVQRGPKGTFVYVVNAEEKVDLRMVDVGPSEGPDTVITKGLAVGELVVTDGLDKLQPGAQVSTRDPNAKDAKAPGGQKPEGAPHKG